VKNRHLRPFVSLRVTHKGAKLVAFGFVQESAIRRARMTAYEITLIAHSYLRWLVVLTSFFLCVRSFMAWRSGRNWDQADERLHVALVATFDMQFAIGLLLYVVLSPLLWAFFTDLGNNIKDPTLRFFGMEHVIAMLAATAIVHVGRVQSKHATTDSLRQRRVWTTTLFALLIICAAIPWPGMSYGRPLLRSLTSSSEVQLIEETYIQLADLKSAEAR
jgi:Na+-driven multidrug efflux pump